MSDREIAESLADRTVPRRGVVGIDKRWLTDEERARLVTVDPYAAGRAAREAATETVELQILTGRGGRVRVPCSSKAERDRITLMVEDGKAAFVVERPRWFVPSGRFRVTAWPSEAEIRSNERLASWDASRRQAAAEAARQRAEAQRALATQQWPSPLRMPMVRRPPSASK